jgi:uncharacterized protein (DUF1800 family)
MFRYSSLALLFLMGSSISVQSAPQVQIQVGSTPILLSSRTTSGGVTIVDFGTTEIGKSVSKTFTLKNIGTETVQLLEPIRVPRGFTLMRRFGSTTLAPGQTSSFVAALNSASAGRLRGNVAFTIRGTQDLRIAVPVVGTAFGSASMRIIQTGDIGFRTVGRWSRVTLQNSRGTAQNVPAGTGASVATWTFTGLQPGQYFVSTTWSVRDAHASNAPFTVVDGTKAFAKVLVNQQLAPADFHDAGVAWKTLGTFRITGNSLAVRLTDQANGPVMADSVRIEKVGFPGRIITPGDKGFVQTGSGNKSLAIWTFNDLVPGQYRVSADWAAGNAQFTLVDGNRGLTTVDVNQQQSPRDFRDAGTSWKDLGLLGTLYRITGNSLTVRMTSASTAAGRAGAIRVERIYNPAGSAAPEGGTTYADAVRYLEQATWGPSDAAIAYVQQVGIPYHIQEQLNTPTSDYPQPDLYPTNQTTGCSGMGPTCGRDNYSEYLLQTRFFTKAFYEQDQLHQRMTWALHKIWVISGRDGNVHPAAHLAAYLRVLDQNALGNFRTLMGAVTLNAGMGKYLDMANSNNGSPNENYAREIMQLFTVGLNLLNPDGTLQLDGSGNPISTYDQSTVYEFARLFTGWQLAPNVRTGVPDYISPMVVWTPETNHHDRGSKTLLNGFTTSPNQSTTNDLNTGLDNIFSHQNVAPFIAKSLIKQLVTSNPSTDYVSRVSAVFNDNGSGVPGDLAAVVQSILLDPEARNMPTDPSYGKLREPVQYINNLCRAFPVTAYNDRTQQSDGYLSPQAVNMDQDVFRPFTVFSYFMPDTLLPGSQTLLAPEFDILTTSTAIRRANFINQMTSPNGGADAYGINVATNSPLGTKLDLSAVQALAGDPAAMLAYLNNIMLHGTMSQDMVDRITPAINAVAASNPLRRAKVAVYLVATSSQYQVQQ